MAHYKAPSSSSLLICSIHRQRVRNYPLGSGLFSLPTTSM